MFEAVPDLQSCGVLEYYSKVIGRDFCLKSLTVEVWKDIDHGVAKMETKEIFGIRLENGGNFIQNI